MKYENIKEAVFIERPNRFIANVCIDGKEEKVHVKNTGRCRELLLKGCRVFLEESKNSARKTKYSLVAVYKGERLINMDSQIPNYVAEEALKKGIIKEIGIPDFVKREVKYSQSRFDIYYEKDGRKGFIEVKGVTLEKNGEVLFPDAPTERGTKHIKELIKAKKEGYEAAVLFVIQMKDVSFFAPNAETDKDFSQALKNAKEEGVNILAYDCDVKEDEIVLKDKVEVRV
jgi:sugar fermentation stimulation protein A